MRNARRWLLITLALAIVIGIAEAASAVGIAVLSPMLDQPIQRTRTIYADQSRLIREMYFTDSARGVVFDAELGWGYRADWRDETSVHTAGLRTERRYDPQPGPGVLRIAAFGDSFVYGNEVPWTDSWPVLMEAGSSDIEVLNYGVGGYGVDQAFLRYLRDGTALAPHVVLIGFYTDDLRRLVNVYRRFLSVSEYPLFKPRFELGDDGGLRLLPMPIASTEQLASLLERPQDVLRYSASDQWYEPLVYANPLYDWSATVRLVTQVCLRFANRYVRSNRMFDGHAFNESSEAFAIQLALFDAFADSVVARGAQPVIVLLPDRESVGFRVAGEPAIYAPLAARLAASDTPVLDVADAFAAEGAGGASDIDHWFMPGGHYSREGNLVVARYLTARLSAFRGRFQ